MTRLRAIALALKLAAPHWHHQQETALELLQLEARWHVPAELVIADVEHESRWLERVINQHSGTVGLMQIQPENDPACRDHHPEVDGCLFVREGLLDWRENLRKGVAIFAFSRAYCAHRGYAEPRDWLWLPTGWDKVSGSSCGHRNGRRLPTPKGIRWLLARAATLRACPSSTGRPAAPSFLDAPAQLGPKR